MARKKRKRVASRGSVNNIILRTLVNGDKYGYEIIKEVEEYSNGKIVLKQPSLYSSLTRFEEKKFVSSYWGDSDIGGRRHYYHLTEEGMEYYRRVVLKETDEQDNDIEEDVQTILEDNNINLNTTTLSNDEDTNQELESNEEDDFMTMNEISQNEIPEIANFEEKTEEDNNDNVIIPDHQFSRVTPIETLISNSNSSDIQQPTTPLVNENDSNNLENNSLELVENEISYEEKINNLRNNSKQSNKKYIENNPKKLYFRKPKKVKKIILDSDGIYKLRDEDYVPRRREPEVIIDNVIKRTKSSGDVFGYASYTNTPSSTKEPIKSTTPTVELTEEEKRQKNENFVAKFNLLTMSKMKPVTAPVPKPEPVVEKKPEPKVDYRGKLNAIFENQNIFVEDNEIAEEETIPDNNMFNYVDEDKWNTNTATTAIQTQSTISEEPEETEDDKFISFDEEETFETKTSNTEYIEEINNYTAPPTPVKMTRYDNITQAVLVDKTYLLNNKLKMIFGIIMSLLMIAEVTILMLVFRNLDLIQPADRTLFVVAFVLIAVFAIIYILPYFLNSNSHKANNFKLKYSIWFGFLTFLVCSILIYCFNALTGFDIDNFKYFAVRIIVPITLLFNFIIGPLVYSLLLKSKTFYD